MTDRVDVARTATLAGNTHHLAQQRFDQGAAPADLPLNRMMLVLKRSPEQESALQDLLQQQQVSSSASFHNWLTPDEFGQQFGPADSDIQAVTSWLASYGFQNIRVARGRQIIEFSGTAAQVESALHTSIHRYAVNGELRWANASDPQIPAALAPVVAGVATLHNFPHKKTIISSDKKLPATVKPGLRPQINLTGSSGLVHALVPGDFATIYNIPSTATGLGATIAVLSNTNINLQDINDFRGLWGLPVNSGNPQIVLTGPDPGDLGGGAEQEAVLDTTWSGAVAPQAQVDLVVGQDTNVALGTDLAEEYVLENNLADVMTASFSGCEAFALSGDAAFYNGLAEQAAAQGITFLVSSGDGGPDTCDDQSTIPSPPTAASVNLLASTDFDLAVGGTEFDDCTPVLSCVDSSTTYWLSSNNATNSESAKGYIPENVWNEVCTASQAASLGCTLGIWSSGGGASTVNTTTPPWQVGVTGLPSGNHPRLLPDVSLTAAGHDGYVVCIIGSCSNPSNLSFGIAAGTSASAQAFGGIMALVVQKEGGRVGIANYALYKLAAMETYSNCNGSAVPSPSTLSGCVFNDVTSGNTNIPGETGFAAAAGFDKATGLGSVNVTNLLNKWSTAIIQPSKTALTLNNGTGTVTITHGTGVTVGVTVTPGTGATTSTTPTGDISLVANTTNPAGTSTGQGVDGFTLTNGAVDPSTNLTTLLPGGSYALHAHYEGDGTYLPSDSNAISVVISKETSETELSIVVNPTATTCAGATAVTYGSAYVLEVAVMNHGLAYTPCAPTETGASPTGQVTLTDSVSGSLGTFTLDPTGGFEDQAIQLTAGMHTISATYVGDSSFSGSGPSTFPVSVSKASTTSSITSHPATIAAGTAFQLTAFVDTLVSANVGSSGAAPTGTITFSATTTGGVFAPSNRHTPAPTPLLIAETLAAIAFLFQMGFANRKHRAMAWLGLAVVTVLAVGTSCGSNGNNGGGSSTTLGTVSVTAATETLGFAAANATLSNVTLTKSATITATYSGDANYSSSMTSTVTVTVQ